MHFNIFLENRNTDGDNILLFMKIYKLSINFCDLKKGCTDFFEILLCVCVYHLSLHNDIISWDNLLGNNIDITQNID